MRINPHSPEYFAAYRNHPNRVEDYSKRNFTKEILDSEKRTAEIEAETAAYRVELSLSPHPLRGEDSTES
jgi:hypothetical protein